MNRVRKIKIVILSVLVLSSFVSVIFYFQNNNKKLTVAFLDVGQGDAIFIEAPNGNQMLLDGGPSKAILRELSKVTPFYDRSIDVVMMSHPDEDHIGGLPDVLKNYSAGLVVEPGVFGESSAYTEIEKIIDDENNQTENLSSTTQNISEGKIKKILARRGMVIDFGGGVFLQILYPVGDVSKLETNTASIVARLVYGENEFLLTGDSPKNIENYLVSLEGKDQNCQENISVDSETTGTTKKFGCLSLKSDVLKVAHHGSKNSTGEEFVKTVSPQYAVISVGKDNRYGHPTEEVLNILQNFGSKIFRTDELGNIIFQSDGVNLIIK